jgi:hypothetical protein
MSESQKETFRKYLEQAGVIEVLVKILVNLYEEPDKPNQALDYIKTSLGTPTPAQFNAIVQERDGLQGEVERLQAEIADLKLQLDGNQ